MTYATELPHAQPAARRSAIPKVIGILMIIFASLALLSGLVGLGNSALDDMQAFAGNGFDASVLAAFAEVERIGKIMSAIGLPISLLHLVAGIAAVRYRAAAPKLSITYALIAGLHTIASTIVSATLVLPAMERMTAAFAGEADTAGAASFMGTAMNLGLVFGAIVGLAWPAIVGALMSRPSARAACAY